MRWMAILITIFQLGISSISHAGELNNLPSPGMENTAHENLSQKTASDIAPGEELLTVSPEMRQFVQSFGSDLSAAKRFRKVLRSLQKSGFELEFDLNHTTNAAEAFAQRRGNCISFSALIVALARESGLEAHFNQVESPIGRTALKTKRGRQVVQNVFHVNAEVTFGWTTKIIEFNFQPRLRYEHRKIPDTHVQALYVNNRALELSFQGKHDEALALLNAGLDLQSQGSMLWTSMGYIYRQKNSFGLAEISYVKALELDPENVSARRNLRRLNELSDQAELSLRLPFEIEGLHKNDSES